MNVPWDQIQKLRDEDYSYKKYKRKRAYHNQTFESHIRENIDEYNECVITVRCKAVFEFKEPLSLKDIPSFFYPNSIAILYPYVRAFVGTLSLQSNIKPIMLPTLNLSGLEGILKNQTKIVE